MNCNYVTCKSTDWDSLCGLSPVHQCCVQTVPAYSQHAPVDTPHVFLSHLTLQLPTPPDPSEPLNNRYTRTLHLSHSVGPQCLSHAVSKPGHLFYRSLASTSMVKVCTILEVPNFIHSKNTEGSQNFKSESSDPVVIYLSLSHIHYSQSVYQICNA